MPSRDSNSDLSYSKAARYQLSYTAPYFCAVETDDYPADLASIFKLASSSVSSATETFEEPEAAVEADRASADSYGECPLCGDLFPLVSLQVRHQI